MQNTVSTTNVEEAKSSLRRSIVSRLQRYCRILMTTQLVLVDVLALLISAMLAFNIRSSMGSGIVSPESYFRLIPLFVAMSIGIFSLRGLYPGVGLSPVEELRRLSITISAIFLFMTAFAYWARSGEIYSRLALAFAWLLSLILVQSGRWLIRIVGVRMGIWGEPVAVIGYGPQGKRIIEFLLNNLRLGLRPVVVIDGFGVNNDYICPIPKIPFPSNDLAKNSLNLNGVQTAIINTSEMPEDLQELIIENQYLGFNRLILISELNKIASVGVIPHDLEGILALEISQNLLSQSQQIIKRFIDVALVMLGSLIALPFMAFIAILIKLDSPGKIFFSQNRIGKDGNEFKMWKFRTMVNDADNCLQEYLEKFPELKKEWMETQKIKNDPRLTRIGKILRKLSLDELPQIYNILRGEMSLVGPRPFLPEQQVLYGKGYYLYIRVRPGMTGLWQVSGRNDTSFEQRAQSDEYYVRNWSVWQDIYILLCTIWVVLRGEGAY
jgi:Undecaprenyl-phosphate galactose phosphotransferase WbaP